MKRIINKIFEIPLIIPIRIALFLLVTLLSYKFLTFFSSEYKFDAKELLNLLISTISIIIAIIITYLFSKLFSEKAERIQRKAEIDTLSHKITAFGKMAFQIRGFSEFWKFLKFHGMKKQKKSSETSKNGVGVLAILKN